MPLPCLLIQMIAMALWHPDLAAVTLVNCHKLLPRDPLIGFNANLRDGTLDAAMVMVVVVPLDK